MKIANLVAVIFALSILTACVTSTDKLKATSGAITEERTYSENYQEIYRRVSTEATRCTEGGLLVMSSLEVDAQLYNELGFGEVSWSLINFGVRNYYWTAKIEKQDEGSKITVTSGNTLGKKGLMKRVLLWADGDKDC